MKIQSGWHNQYIYKLADLLLMIKHTIYFRKYGPLLGILCCLMALEYALRQSQSPEELHASTSAQAPPETQHQVLGGGQTSYFDTQTKRDFRLQNLLPLLLKGFSDNRQKVSISPNSILVLNLRQPISEQGSDNPLEDFVEEAVPFLGQEGNIGLLELVKTLEKAQTDDNIKGILLDLGTVNAGFASLEEIRNALLQFKKTKKPIFAYGEYLSENAYYLASIADAIFLNPSGNLELNGLVSEQVYFKGAMDKLGIKAEIFRVGTYKSAIEPFTREDMSEESRAQITSFLNSIYDHYLAQVGKARNLEVAELRRLSDEFLIQTPEDALEFDLITHIGYQDEMMTYIDQKIQLKKQQKANLVAYKQYLKSPDTDTTTREKSNDKIALIIAEGEIMGGSGERQGIIGSEQIIRLLREVREDTLYKAIVLRINSPGGSALASDIIWREIELTKKVKPVVASMSDLAASGGYYLAMACDEIVAQPNTITGSIGIFGMLLDMEGFLKEKLGITTDRVGTGQFSDIGNPSRPVKEAEKQMIQNMVEKGYRTFTRKAAEGRNMSIEDLKEVAQGRVWSGAEARSRGLVDTLGGFGLAVERAAARANLENYELVYLPKKESFLEKIMKSLDTQAQMQPLARVWREVPAFFSNEYWLYRIKYYDLLQMRLPCDIYIK